MRINTDRTTDSITIRSYSRGVVTINNTEYRNALILSNGSVASLAELSRAAALTLDHAAQLLATDPQIVLVGTAQADDWPDAAWRAYFLTRGIGVEVMNTGAACRTYTVLASERRRVAAVLLP